MTHSRSIPQEPLGLAHTSHRYGPGDRQIPGHTHTHNWGFLPPTASSSEPMEFSTLLARESVPNESNENLLPSSTSQTILTWPFSIRVWSPSVPWTAMLSLLRPPEILAPSPCSPAHASQSCLCAAGAGLCPQGLGGILAPPTGALGFFLTEQKVFLDPGLDPGLKA